MLAVKVRLRRLKFWHHLILAYVSRYKLRIASAVLIAVVFTTSAIKLIPLISRSNVISVGFVGVYTIETLPAEVLTLATNSLISADETGRPTPSLASHWTVSEDGKTYIVFLKDNLIWHDSTAVDAKDISIAIKDVKITAINNKTLEFKLPNPIASFPQALNKPIFKSQTFYGTGEFRIIKIDRVENIVKKIVLHPKNPDLPRVDIKFYPTEEQLLEAIKIGEVKTASVVNANIFNSWHNLNVERKIDNFLIVTIFLNNEDQEIASKEFRQALNFAIDRTTFDGETAISPISPASWAFNAQAKRYDYNVAKAKELLLKSGVKDPKITLTTTAGLDKIAEKIKKSWQAIGVQVEIKEEKTLPANFQALLAINKITPDPDQYSLWHSTQKETNITHYKNVKIDKLLEDARGTIDESKRKELYMDFQRFLEEDSPAIFLYHPYKYTITYKNAQDLLSKLTAR